MEKISASDLKLIAMYYLRTVDGGALRLQNGQTRGKRNLYLKAISSRRLRWERIIMIYWIRAC